MRLQFKYLHCYRQVFTLFWGRDIFLFLIVKKNFYSISENTLPTKAGNVSSFVLHLTSVVVLSYIQGRNI